MIIAFLITLVILILTIVKFARGKIYVIYVCVRRFFHIFLDLLHWKQPERDTLIHAAKAAGIMRAALGDGEQKRICLHRRSVNRAIVLKFHHCSCLLCPHFDWFIFL